MLERYDGDDWEELCRALDLTKLACCRNDCRVVNDLETHLNESLGSWAVSTEFNMEYEGIKKMIYMQIDLAPLRLILLNSNWNQNGKAKAVGELM